MKIAMVAGEPSGDELGARLVSQLLQYRPDLQSFGLGGPSMQRLGFQSLYEMERLSVMGLLEPIRRLPDLFALRKGLLKQILAERPPVFIGIDSPDFNIGLELKLHQSNIPIVHYVSPSVWAWRSSRIHRIKEAVDRMLTLFPFEEQFYRRHHVKVDYVGHPLAHAMPLRVDTPLQKSALGLNAKGPVIALLAGSREQEIHHMAPIYLQTAQRIKTSLPNQNVTFVAPHVSDIRKTQFCKIAETVAPELQIEHFVGKTQEVLSASDVVVVTSGTATLQAMFAKKPMVIAYRMHPAAFFVAKYLVKTPMIGLPNLLANELIVPECIQNEANPETIASHVLTFLTDSMAYDKVVRRFYDLHEEMQKVPENAAATVVFNHFLQ